MIDPREITVIAATGIEARAIRRECPSVRVIESGVALAKVDRAHLGDAVVSCGFAGGTQSYDTGTVLVPREVVRVDGSRIQCDPRLREALVESARRLGNAVVEDPLITIDTIARGAQRAELGARGYAGVDMESGLLEASRVAVVRVILDTPARELSDAWLVPATALLKPRLWPQAFWLARNAPDCARRAARVMRYALAR